MTTPTPWSLKPDSVALVTGGTSGIGRAIAEALARAGANVIATGLEDEEVAACRECDFQSVKLDVTDEGTVTSLVAGLTRLDILVNCAGTIARDGREFDPAGFARVVDVNLTGTMRVCTACRPLLARQGGAVVNLASMLSFFGSPYAPAYSASKGGIVQLRTCLQIA